MPESFTYGIEHFDRPAATNRSRNSLLNLNARNSTKPDTDFPGPILIRPARLVQSPAAIPPPTAVAQLKATTPPAAVASLLRGTPDTPVLPLVKRLLSEGYVQVDGEKLSYPRWETTSGDAH